ncbi:hypothetical protein ACRE_034000 [Hapsidospora chrysogenum ATCC 11550]|uniref:Uncharacterized protein n=1 Tax=Hapsidospora chrysogenum (strain ATCC 11550 / CBS 779.69 / DSM 880 / IAM 14645 / JCM 23072 / IMI 49137) TaxID=857340 RepID=A0A086T8X8_HAPC1|nr:hypothetical protein ACRE_034000 [Hapsidospora chrysogenum ATCC 11550]
MASLFAAPPTPPFTTPSTPPRSVPAGPRGARHIDVFAMARVQDASARLQGVLGGSRSWRSPGGLSPDSSPDSSPLAHLMPPANLARSPFRHHGNKRVCTAPDGKTLVAASPGDVRAIPRGGPTLEEALAGSSPPQTPTQGPVGSQPGVLSLHKMTEDLYYQLQVRRNNSNPPKLNPRAWTIADDRLLIHAVLTNLAQNASSPAWARVARILGKPWDADAARRRLSDIVDGGAIAVSRSIDQHGPARACGPVPTATYNDDDPLLVSAVVSQAAKVTSTEGWDQVSALLGCRRDAVGARERFTRLVAEGVIYLSRSVEPKS